MAAHPDGRDPRDSAPVALLGLLSCTPFPESWSPSKQNNLLLLAITGFLSPILCSCSLLNLEPPPQCGLPSLVCLQSKSTAISRLLFSAPRGTLGIMSVTDVRDVNPLGHRRMDRHHPVGPGLGHGIAELPCLGRDLFGQRISLSVWGL